MPYIRGSFRSRNRHCTNEREDRKGAPKTFVRDVFDQPSRRRSSQIREVVPFTASGLRYNFSTIVGGFPESFPEVSDRDLIFAFIPREGV